MEEELYDCGYYYDDLEIDDLELDGMTINYNPYGFNLPELEKTINLELSQRYDERTSLDFLEMGPDKLSIIAHFTDDDRRRFFDHDKDSQDIILEKLDIIQKEQLEIDGYKPITKLNEKTIEDLNIMVLNRRQVEVDMTNMTLEERNQATSMIDKAEGLRNEYSDFYESELRDIFKGFILSTDVPEILHFEARLKSNASIYNSVTTKPEYDSPEKLNDFVGVRFVVNSVDDAYDLAESFCDREIVEKDNFTLFKSKDYFETPKMDGLGNKQYEALHLILERNGRRIELQIHTADTLRAAELTHGEYKDRVRIERKTKEIERLNNIHTKNKN